MLAVCIECSHQRGMGHLFRALNLLSVLKQREEPYILLVNRDEAALRILKERGISPIVVDLWDEGSGWEKQLIAEHGVTVWLNDRLDTGRKTAEYVKEMKIPLFTIDDMGEGAVLADGNFASLIFEHTEKVPGKKVYAGSDYLILNPEIAACRRVRRRGQNILVTLGGSDTYGVTLRVISFLKGWRRDNRDKQITILLGPGSVIRREAEAAVAGTDMKIVSAVPSLISFLQEFDLAITGGGVTCLEAAASGLPCLVVANELHEISIGQHIEQTGCGIFAGYYKEMKLERIREMEDIEQMSQNGIKTVNLSGAERICRIMLGR